MKLSPLRSAQSVFAATLLLSPFAVGFSALTAAHAAEPPAVSLRPLFAQPMEVPADKDGSRLSDWLIDNRQALSAMAQQRPFDEGLVYGTERLVPAQRALKNSLLAELFDSAGSDHPLYRMVDAMPVTGRVVLPHQDARLLQARPKSDPVLAIGDKVAVPPRSSEVVVLDKRGVPCVVRLEAGREVAEYVRKCRPEAVNAQHQVWLVQPDGNIHRIALGGWAQAAQVLPQPGAWLWLDDKVGLTVAQGRWLADWVRAVLPGAANGKAHGESFGSRMAQWLATQGPAVLAEELGKTEMELAAPSGELQAPPVAVKSLNQPAWVDGSPLMYKSRNLPISSGDFGSVGLFQTPTARMKPEGSFTYTMSLIDQYRQYNIFVQPFEWLEGGFRYTKILNRDFAPGTDETYTDKGIDVKARLVKESAYIPDISVGVRDIGGTGLFSGEFVVASKRYGDFDFSLGMGWGYLGKRGDIRNPLGRIASSFDTRVQDGGSKGGEVGTKAFFHGPAALFGGVQYHTPFDPLTLKLEYDGNDYQKEPLGNVFPQDSRWNYGLVYKVSDLFDIRVARERGNTTMVGFSLSADLLGPATQKILDKPVTPVVPKRDNRPADWDKAVVDIRNETEWAVREVRRNGKELTLSVQNARGFYFGPKVERTAAILNREAPDDIDWLNIEYNDRTLGLATQSVDRKAFVKERTEYVPPAEQTPVVTARAATKSSSDTSEVLYSAKREVSNFIVAPTFQQTLGGPSGFLFYQLGLGVRGQINLTEKTWWSGFAKYRLVDNYDNYGAAGKDGTLPEVRSLLRDYQTASRVNITNLQLTHVEKFGSSHYASAYGGLLEWMFGGVGAEYLYRPFGSRLALGVDVNRVRQRTFEQKFDFRDYQVNTGHVTAYWDTGIQDIQVKLSAGQYLAGDRGFTLDLSRAFGNGVVMGGFFSRTNVTPEQFGEGSFDKGIYIGIPFDVMLPKSSSGYMVAGWQPLTRDGGAKLQRGQALFGLTDKAGSRTLFNEAVQGTTFGR